VPGASAAATALAAIEYASMAIVTLAYPRSRFPATQGQARSGYLVPAVEGRAVKAVTFSTVKWPHLTDQSGPNGPDDPIDIIRCSIGRIGEESVLQRDDADLVALAVADLAGETGAQGAPVDTRVTRWGGGLPQYTVGHLDRVATIGDSVAAQPGLAVCGAAYAGVGIPACIATADAAAHRVRAFFAENQKG
jgi:oxygen-dependent protoporphyrinogen oxidase